MYRGKLRYYKKVEIMTMSKKDYELVAGVFAEHMTALRELIQTEETDRTIRVVTRLAAFMSREFSIENPRFNSSRFLTACDIHPMNGGQ